MVLTFREISLATEITEKDIRGKWWYVNGVPFQVSLDEVFARSKIDDALHAGKKVIPSSLVKFFTTNNRRGVSVATTKALGGWFLVFIKIKPNTLIWVKQVELRDGTKVGGESKQEAEGVAFALGFKDVCITDLNPAPVQKAG